MRFGGHGRSIEREERAPPLWQQIRAGQGNGGFGGGRPSSPPREIEGRATVVAPARREGEPNIGDRVTHEKFGEGTIRRIDHDKLEVAFDKKGVLKVMARFVKVV